MWRKIKALAKTPFVEHQATYNIIIALATAFTLIWGGITFKLLKQKEKAEYELNEIHTRIKNSESTTVNVKTKVFKGAKGKYFFIYPTVTIKNNGKEEIVLKLNNESMTVSKVYFEGEKALAENIYNLPFFEKISSDSKIDSKKLTMIAVPIDAERTIPYALKITCPGTYYITFSADAYLDDKKKEIGGHQFHWFSSEYINVQ